MIAGAVQSLRLTIPFHNPPAVAPRPIPPIRRPLRDVRARVPASKSVANRELVLSALADGRSTVELGPLDPGDDVRAMRRTLAALGHDVRLERGGKVVVRPSAAAEWPPEARVDCGEAGTVARFGLALAATRGGAVRVDGGERLRERPLEPLVRALRALGATVEGDRLPLVVRGPARGGQVTVPGDRSSQFASALLLIAPRLPDGLRLRVAGALVSAPYVELTVAALRERGVRVERPSPAEFDVRPRRVRARAVRVPGDASAATYPAAAAAILGGGVTILDVDARRRTGGQGDVRAFDLLARMGCRVDRGGSGVTVRREGTLYGIREEVMDCSDAFPTLAVVAACATTPTELTGIGHTRRQESDRIAAVADGLRALGGDVTAYADAIRIQPAPLHGGVVDARGDHRVAMAFSVLGLHVPGVAIEGWESVTKTFPGFYDMLSDLAK